MQVKDLLFFNGLGLGWGGGVARALFTLPLVGRVGREADGVGVGEC